MTEHRAPYLTNTLLQTVDNNATMDAEADALRMNLPDLERLLMSLLVTVQKAQGKEPTVGRKAERRRG